MAPVRLRVVGKRGAVVRSGAALDSAKVVTLARGTDWTAGLQAALEQAFPRISAWEAPAEA